MILKDVLLPIIVYVIVLMIYIYEPDRGLVVLVMLLISMNVVTLISMVHTIFADMKRHKQQGKKLFKTISEYSAKIGTMNHKRLQYISTITGVLVMLVTR